MEPEQITLDTALQLLAEKANKKKTSRKSTGGTAAKSKPKARAGTKAKTTSKAKSGTGTKKRATKRAKSTDKVEDVVENA